jgi:hypothetical protein
VRPERGRSIFAAMTPDGLLVPCDACGAPCAAADVDRVTCAHCGASVPVPPDVRTFIHGLHGHAISSAVTGLQLAQFRAVATGAPVPDEDTWDERREAMEVERVGAACPNCGMPQEYGGHDKERCPACGTESVAHLAGSVQIIMGGLATTGARFKAMNAIAVQAFPIGKGGPFGTWRCGACAAPLRAAPSTSSQALERCAACGKHNAGHQAASMLAMIRAVVAGREHGTTLAQFNAQLTREAELEAQLDKKRAELAEAVRKADEAARRLAEHRRKNPHALLFSMLVFPGIALVSWIGYHIDIALQNPAPAPTSTYARLPIAAPVELPIPMPRADPFPGPDGPDAAADSGAGAGGRSGARSPTRHRAGPAR